MRRADFRFGIALPHLVFVLQLVIFLSGSFAPAAAASEGAEDDALRFEGEATLGAKLYLREFPFDHQELAGWSDQYIYTRNKDPDGGVTAYFVDLLRADLALVRADNTRLLHLTRRSFNPLNELGELSLSLAGLELGVWYQRYRSDELRFFPTGVGENGLFGTFAQVYTPDTRVAELLDHNRRIYSRRQSVGGALSLRLEELGLANPILREAFVDGHYQRRNGYRQDSFLLAALREAVPDQTTRFRGNRRETEQAVGNARAGLVLEPFGLFTAVLDAEFEGFRERAPVVRWSDIAAQIGGFPPPPPPRALREFLFVPDTNRATARLELTRRIDFSDGRGRPHSRSLSLRGGGSFTQLEQTGRRSLLQQEFELEDMKVTSYTAYASFNWRVRRRVGMIGLLKFSGRHNPFHPEIYEPGLITRLGQETPHIEDRFAIASNFELDYRPRASSLLAVGFRSEYVDRDLEYAGVGGIQPGVSLMRPVSESYTVYLRGRSRLMRQLRLSAELGYTWAPETAYTRDLDRFVSFSGRATRSFSWPFPVDLVVAGRVTSGENDDLLLVGESPAASRRKRFDRTDWGYDLTLSGTPAPGLMLFATFAQQGDGQAFNHIRSDRPRNRGSLEFFNDSWPSYDSDVLSISGGGSYALTPQLELSLATIATLNRVDYDQPSYSRERFTEGSEIDSRIVGFDADLEYRIHPALSLGLGYRLDSYVDRASRGALRYDENAHTIGFRMTADLALVGAQLRGASSPAP